jgi:signal transduction histidine kinase/ligand-binding sensor domain-containing protein
MKINKEKKNGRPPKLQIVSSLFLLLTLSWAQFIPVEAVVFQNAPDFPHSPLQFDRITVQDGLSSDAVQTILQTSDGFMWFGTQNGLNQYNGYDFEHFLVGDRSSTALQGYAIYALLEDVSGGLWVGTNQGLDYFLPDSESVVHYSKDAAASGTLSSNQISVLFQDQNQIIWVGTQDNGLNRLDPQTSQIQSYQYNRFNSHSIGGNQIKAIQEDSAGNLWVATENGLNRYDPEADRFEHFSPEVVDSLIFPQDDINAMVIDAQDGIWLGTNGMGLVYFNQKTQRITRYRTADSGSNGIASDVILSLELDRNHDLWIGLDKGLDKFYPTTQRFSHLNNAPQSSFWVHNAAVHCIYEDRGGILWVASDFGGVSKYDPLMDRFTLLQAQKNNPQSLAGNDVTGITETQEGLTWISTYGDGITLYDRKTQQFSLLQHKPSDPTSLSSNKIRTLKQSSDGHIWVGTVGAGLDRYRPSTGIFTHFIHQEEVPTSISENHITAILEDHAGRMWIGTYSQGLNLALPGDQGFLRFQHENGNPDSIQDDHILALYEDDENNLWIGTWNGITVFSPEKKSYRHYVKDPHDSNSLPSNMVFSFYQSDPDTIWIGTNGGGVSRLDLRSNTFLPLQVSDDVLNTVYAIMPAPDGSLWFSSNQGIIHYDPFRGTMRVYDERDGLQANNFNAGAFYQNPSGDIYFGGSNGLNSFNPQNVYPSAYVPPVALLSVKSGDEVIYRNIADSVQVVLPSGANKISFEFAMLDFSSAHKNKYAYQLVGYDEQWVYSSPGRRYYEQDSIKDVDREWHYIAARRVASYNNLPDGSYLFKVKGTNIDSIWSTDVLSVEVIIKPPFWKSAWFPLGLAVLVIGLVFVGNIYRSRRIAELNQALEFQVKERTFEIQQKQEVAEGLRDILAYINSDQSLEKILGHLGDRSLRLIGADAYVILQYEEGIILAEGQAGFKDALLEQLARDPLQFLRNLFTIKHERDTVLINNLQKFIRQKVDDKQPEASVWLNWQLSMGILFHGLMIVPILVRGGNVAGTLLYFFGHAGSLIKKQAELSELGIIFADQAALAIENALLREHAETNAVIAERNRIARDLHDAVTQTLFSASLVAEVLPRIYATNPSDGSEMLHDLQLMTRGALAEMRTLLIELRPTSFNEMPLCDLIRQLAESFISKLDVPVEISIKGDSILPAQVQTAVFRIAQESLNNIQKHGMAKHVGIHLTYNDQSLMLQISDNGCGFDCEKVNGGHLGLKIMNERALSIGAKLEIQSKINQGTWIILEWVPQDL